VRRARREGLTREETGHEPRHLETGRPRKRLPRTFQGMPPQIPHDVEGRKGLCQECHTTGQEKAPITPHPTRFYFCLNCHVGQTSNLPPFETTRPK
jgi:nitrate reductase cytochrome c-type subunit